MIDGWTIVLDVGKTHAKISLWDEHGASLAGGTRPNASPVVAGVRALDADGIEQWLIEALGAFANRAPVRRIIPVGHGAAAAILRDGRLLYAPLDYEQPVDEAESAAYASQRDPFSATGSPLLPDGLNLGMQLHTLESRYGPLPDDATILPWPQFWAWRLCGVAAAEVTSLGCHSDLWRPLDARYSDLAERRGWARRMAPLRHASEVLATITTEIASRTGLPKDCEVLCGLHDSNAALLAARGHREIGGHEATVLSTGTWFIVMRSPANAAAFDPATLPEHCDCLINVDVDGRPVPSARFMGGRDAELIRQADFESDELDMPLHASMAVLKELLAGGLRIYPSLVPGVGPYPDAAGELHNLPDSARTRRAAASLYLALMADSALDLIGSRARLLIEGRFAEDPLFAGLLASLRPGQQLLTGGAGGDLAYGALRLVAPALEPATGPVPVEPLKIGLEAFGRDWRQHATAASTVNWGS